MKNNTLLFFYALIGSACIVFNAHSKEIEVVESKYNTIIIHERPPYISMRFGYNTKLYTESVFNTQDPLELPVKYTQFMGVGLAYTPELANLLEVGSGGGRFSSYMASTIGSSTMMTTVELDPEVISLSEKYFELSERPNLKIENSDGRLFLVRNGGRYDAIFVDAYRGPFVPFHLLTKEFYELISNRLNEGGVLVQNVEPSTMLFDAALATIGFVFDNLDIYVAGGNVVVAAYDGPERTRSQLTARARAIDSAFEPRYRLEQMLRDRRIVDKSKIEADPLSDDFAPAQYLRSIELHNRRYEEITK
jgi:spermidine synthase